MGLAGTTAVINNLQNFPVPCDCRQELEYLNAKPTDIFVVQETETAQIDMSFSDLVFLRPVLSPLSLVGLGTKTLKQEFCLRCSELVFYLLL